MITASDEVLVQRIAAGNRAAMGSLYARHNMQVYRFLLRLMRNPSSAEDVLSDGFLDVWQQAARFEGRSTALTWIFSIARFKALSAMRRKTPGALDPEFADAIEDEADTPEVTAQKASKAEIMRRCLTALSTEHRAVIDLVYYHECSVEEVSEILGIPANTVKTRMFYARRRLAEMLAAAGLDRGWP
jgi:RNA polymerase sigma-70 factor (ECF subfamily)